MVDTGKSKAFKFFVGIDISKLHLDVAIIFMGHLCSNFRVTNNASGFKELLKKVRKLPNLELENTLFCMESTGIYNQMLADYLLHIGGSVWVENPLQIKRSQGIVRGKSDKQDAQLIAEYAYRFVDKFRPYAPLNPAVKKLEALHKQRAKLLKIKHQILQEIKELEAMGMHEVAELRREIVSDTLENIEVAIKKCRKMMKQIIKENEDIKKLYDLLITVEGVDLLVGVYLIYSTGCFKRITNARRYCTHIGIVSFEYTSGTSVKKRKRTSNQADKMGKQLITSVMGNAIRKYGGLKTYYNRKIAEGKPGHTVTNACKNKMVHRIFAVVKSGKPYNKFHEWQLK